LYYLAYRKDFPISAGKQRKTFIIIEISDQGLNINVEDLTVIRIMEYSESEESCWSISDEYRCEYAGTIIVSAASEKYDSPEEGVTSVVLVVEGKKLHYTREVCML